MAGDQIEITRKHIQSVQRGLHRFATELMERGVVHDESKFSDDEMIPLKQMQTDIDTRGPAPYGSDLYNERTKMLGPMLDSHYRKNSHHPQHYEQKYGGPLPAKEGIAGMTLGDLVEMFFDWKAASERNGEKVFNLTTAFNDKNMDPQLRAIFENTARAYGWEIK